MEINYFSIFLSSIILILSYFIYIKNGFKINYLNSENINEDIKVYLLQERKNCSDFIFYIYIFNIFLNFLLANLILAISFLFAYCMCKFYKQQIDDKLSCTE